MGAVEGHGFYNETSLSSVLNTEKFAFTLSGDSTLYDVRYANGCLSFRYADYDSDEIYLAKIQTRLMYAEEGESHYPIHVRLINLSDHLASEQNSGRYVAVEDFGRQIQAVRECWHLAYGLQTAEYPYLFQIRHSSVVLACPVFGANAVSLELCKDESEP